MKAFMDDDFLLDSPTAQALYHEYAARLPIIDYHCHVDPADDIAQNRRFENIAQLWLGGDHYKWRIMRAHGADERLITGGESTDYEKFMAFASALPKAAGNPVYHWAHLELRRYFDCALTLGPDTAREIWEICNAKLAGHAVRDIIRHSRVEVIATTDDPADDLAWHDMLARDDAFETKVLPSFRPDKALAVDTPEFVAYMETLGRAAGMPIKTMDDVFAALHNRLDFFEALGCRAADHGLVYVPYAENAELDAPKLFAQAMRGEGLTIAETDAYKTALLLFLGRQYARRGWVMQLHYGVQRDINTVKFHRLGPDAGYDAINGFDSSRNIAALLNALERSDELPKTVLYSLNPGDDALLASLIGCFMESGTLCKVQQGSAWWFNDTKQGMEAQLTSLASRGLLGGFIGMLTDSRSFLSYTRHEYFRRILCNLLGRWVENGEYPGDMKILGDIVRDIGYYNPKNYFRF